MRIWKALVCSACSLAPSFILSATIDCEHELAAAANDIPSAGPNVETRVASQRRLSTVLRRCARFVERVPVVASLHLNRLGLAILANDSSVATEELQKGELVSDALTVSDVLGVGYGTTPLHLAALYGDRELVEVALWCRGRLDE